MMNAYLERHLISSDVVNSRYGLSALNVPRPIFAKGYISGCGDALYSSNRLIVRGQYLLKGPW